MNEDDAIKCGDGSYHTLLLPLPYLPRCSRLLVVLVKRSVEHFFLLWDPPGLHLPGSCVLWGGCQARMMLLVLLLSTSTDLFKFYCTGLFLHTTLEGSSVHTYLPTTNWSTDRLEHGWMKKSCTVVVKAKRVTTQINGHVLNAHALSNSAIAFLELCAKLKPPARC